MTLLDSSSFQTNDESTLDDVITLSFTVRCALDIHQSLNVTCVRMASSLFSGWSLDQSLPMHQSTNDANVYVVNVEVPVYLPHFAFKYITTD